MLPLWFGFGQDAFGQPSNYYWQQEFNEWSSTLMTVNSPVNGIVSFTQKAISSADQFNIYANEYNDKWQNTSTPFNEEYTIYHGDGGSSDSYLQTPTTTGHYYTLQIEGLAYSNRNAVLMETTNAPQSFKATDPVTPSNPSIIPGQDLNLTITLAGNKSPEERAFVRCTKDGFSTSYLVEVSFATSTSSNGTATIPGGYNTADSDIDFYVYTTTVNANASSNHDLIALKIANDGGSNYHYPVRDEWISVADGNWDEPATWQTNAIPPDRQKIKIGAGTTVTINVDTVKIGALEMEPGGKLIGNTNTTVVFPGGGYTTTYGGLFKPYNLIIGKNTGASVSLYVDDDFEIQHDLTIRENGRLVPGEEKTPTINMSGMSGSFYNYGILDCNPVVTKKDSEKLKFYFSGSTMLRGNAGAGAYKTKFSDITIPALGALTADAGGVLNAELQFGTLECEGQFNMGQAGVGFVNFTLRGEAGNTYNLKSSNTNQIFQFHNLIIGNVALGIAKFGLDNSSESVEMRISGDFEDYSHFEPSNGSETIKTVFNGAGTNQTIKGQIGQTAANTIVFSKLEIDNTGGSVSFETTGGGFDSDDNIQISISDNLTLTNGRIITFDSATPARHKLLLEAGASIDYSGAQSNDLTPCYIEGPISRALNTGSDQELDFPVGQGDEYRLLKIHTDASASSEFTVESFHYSPADFTGMELEYPILNISGTRFWNIKTTKSASTSNTTISIAYGNYLTDGVNSESDLRIVWAEEDASTDEDDDNNEWKLLGENGGSSNTITSNAFNFDTLVSKIDITLGNVAYGVNPLPVTWLYFNGHHTYSGNELEWATGSESNNEYFEIERSVDARTFESIGQISSLGDSKKEQVYHFTDRLIESPLYYYRIKQVDRDGKSDYSRIISISHSVKAGIYPNPFREKLIISQFEDGAEGVFQIWDASGKLVLKQSISDHSTEIETTPLALGMYTGRLILQNRNPEVFKLVKSR